MTLRDNGKIYRPLSISGPVNNCGRIIAQNTLQRGIPMQVETAILDIDGTLVITLPIEYQALQLFVCTQTDKLPAIK
jgi:hypothetical protein